MPLGLYMDVHVPRAITVELRRRGVSVVTAQEDDAATLPDPTLLDRATALGRVVFTMDDDFLAEAARRQRTGVPFGGVVFARQLHISIGECVGDLELIATLSSPEEFQDKVVYLPL